MSHPGSRDRRSHGPIAIGVHDLPGLEGGDFGHIDDVEHVDSLFAQSQGAVAADGEVAQRVGAGDSCNEQGQQGQGDGDYFT